MNYTIKLDSTSATILTRPDVYLHFGHLDFDTVWNADKGRHESVRGVDSFYGGMGEGTKYNTWQDAILASLYDAYQVYDGFNTGDTFVAEYLGQTANFVCDGVHVRPL